MAELSRKEFLQRTLAAAIGGALGVGLPATALGTSSQAPATATPAATLTLDDLRGFARVIGLEFTDEELKAALADLQGEQAALTAMRQVTDDHTLGPAAPFRVRGVRDEARPRVDVRIPLSRRVTRPDRDDDLLFLPIPDLGHLLRQGEVSSQELTAVALDRLARYGSALACVVELTPDLALRQARQADADFRAGRDRGPLQGIPYGLKDLFSVRGTRTQWGTAAYRNQRLDVDATVYRRLRDAGAVHCAKLSLGALAMNDVWFGGRTRNPWNPEQGSSGSSAGSASAVAAGLLPFAIGTETSGSIVSPAHRCRVTGLRPTFGRVSRYGAMSLAWTMDKVGPLARTAEDALLILAALVGVDAEDHATLAQSLVYRRPRSLRGLRLGVAGELPAEVRADLDDLGVEWVTVTPPATPPALGTIIGVECAAMFDGITRDGRLNQVTENGWPRIFRGARFTGAVEFAQCDRLRGRLMKEWEDAAKGCDAIIAKDSALAWIYALNLVGWPQVLVPRAPNEQGREQSISLIGAPLSEPRLVGIAAHLQQRWRVHQRQPDLSQVLKSGATSSSSAPKPPDQS